MLLSQLPAALSEWPECLHSAPWWQLTPQALLPVAQPLDGAWLVLFGKPLAARHLARLAELLAAQDIQAQLYPPSTPAGVPLLLLGTDRFSPSWCSCSRPKRGTSTSAICPRCLP